jgi:hypothetical protein
MIWFSPNVIINYDTRNDTRRGLAQPLIPATHTPIVDSETLELSCERRLLALPRPRWVFKSCALQLPTCFPSYYLSRFISFNAVATKSVVASVHLWMGRRSKEEALLVRICDVQLWLWMGELFCKCPTRKERVVVSWADLLLCRSNIGFPIQVAIYGPPNPPWVNQHLHWYHG